MGERLSWNEAEGVVRAYRAERGLSADVDVAALARALGTDVAEIRRLAGRKPRFVDRSGVLSAGLAFAVAAFVTIAMGPRLFGRHALRTAQRLAPPAQTVFIVADPEGRVHALNTGEFKAGSAPYLWAYPADESHKM